MTPREPLRERYAELRQELERRGVLERGYPFRLVLRKPAEQLADDERALLLELSAIWSDPVEAQGAARREGPAAPSGTGTSGERKAMKALAYAGAAVLVGGAGLGLYLLLSKGDKAPAPPDRADRAPSSPKVERLQPAGLLWTGPVSRAQVGDAILPGVPLVVHPCTGDGDPSCGQIADRAKGPDGRRLPKLRAELGLPSSGPLMLSGFSAGGHLIWRALQDPRDRADVAAVFLSDATYIASGMVPGLAEWRDERARIASPIPAFVEYGKDLLRDPRRLFIATASSSPNKNHPSGSETLTAIAAELGLTTVSPAELGLVLSNLFPRQLWMNTARNVILMDFGDAFSHGEHPTKLAQVLWPLLVVPFFAGRSA